MHGRYHHYYHYPAAHHFGGMHAMHGGGLMNLIMHAFIWGLVGHVLSAVFRGHSLIGTIGLTIGLGIGAFIIYKVFFRRRAY
jgi:hypothetical protein